MERKKANQTNKRRGEKSPRQKKEIEWKAEDHESFSHGDILTTVFENRDGRGEIYFRFVQQRQYVWSGKTCYCASFRPGDAIDVSRGAAEAYRRIQQRQRRFG